MGWCDILLLRQVSLFHLSFKFSTKRIRFAAIWLRKRVGLLKDHTCACALGLDSCVTSLLLESSFLVAQAGQKRATLQSSVTASILFGFENNRIRVEVKHERFKLNQASLCKGCAIQPEVRCFWITNRVFPGSLVSRPLAKGNEDSGYKVDELRYITLTL